MSYPWCQAHAASTFPPREIQGRAHQAARELAGASERGLSVCSVTSVVADPATPRLQPARLLCPWGFPGNNTGVGPPPGDLPSPGIKPTSPVSPALGGGFFTMASSGKPLGVPYLYLFPIIGESYIRKSKEFNLLALVC